MLQAEGMGKKVLDRNKLVTKQEQEGPQICHRVNDEKGVPLARKTEASIRLLTQRSRQIIKCLLGCVEKHVIFI